jgi:hypothetical protein
MIQLISSYLFAERRHLNSFYVRRTDSTQEFWTREEVEGPKMMDVPVFVLTSGFTFSAAEEFTYNLKHMGRATIVGETTGGGAHPVSPHEVKGYPLEVSLPFGRAINPITGSNWEGTGVEPHLAVAAEMALDRAHRAALEELIRRQEDDQDARDRLRFLSESLELRQKNLDISVETLAAYAGRYGSTTIALDSAALHARRHNRPAVRLLAVGDDLFVAVDRLDLRLQFERDASGGVVRLVAQFADGHREAAERSDPGETAQGSTDRS